MSGSIAICAISCRLPEASSPQAFWRNLMHGRRAFRSLPETRLSLASYDRHRVGAADAITPIEAGLLTNWTFDRERFGVSEADLRNADLSHWLALDVAGEALDALGGAGALTLERVGVIVASSVGGELARTAALRARQPFLDELLGQAIHDAGLDAEAGTRLREGFANVLRERLPEAGPASREGLLLGTIAGRIARQFQLSGGAYNVDGAGASSLLALADAADKVASGALDAAVVAAVDLSFDPLELIGLSRSGVLSAGRMRVFDARADGYWPGEGAAACVVMREKDARARGLPVLALLRGVGTASGASASPDEMAQVQELAAGRAHERGGVAPDEIVFLEAHGMGTAEADAAEIRALAAIYGRRGQPLPIGSAKANIGHARAASGLAGLVKLVHSFRAGAVPPHVSCDVLSPAFGEADGRLLPLRGALPLAGERSAIAALSGAGTGGVHVQVRLEAGAPSRATALREAPRQLIGIDQGAELFVFAADTGDDLLRQIERVLPVAERLSLAQCIDLAAELARRARFGLCRLAIVADRGETLSRRLADAAAWLRRGGSEADRPAQVLAALEPRTPRICFLFSGQGSPIRGPSTLWARRFPGLKTLARAMPARFSADAADPANAQASLTLANLAGLQALSDLGIAGDLAIGHGLGEIAALVFAGALEPVEALAFSAHRGHALKTYGELGGGMAHVATSEAGATTLIAGTGAVVAWLNGPADSVVAGPSEALSAVRERADAGGINFRAIPGRYAFNTAAMAPACEPLAPALQRLRISEPRLPLISTLTGRTFAPTDAAKEIRDLLQRQLTQPVLFDQAISQLRAADTLFIECGSGLVLTHLARARGFSAYGLDTQGDDFAPLVEALAALYVAGADLDLEALYRDRGTYPFDVETATPTLLASLCSEPVAESQNAIIRLVASNGQPAEANAARAELSSKPRRIRPEAPFAAAEVHDGGPAEKGQTRPLVGTSQSAPHAPVARQQPRPLSASPSSPPAATLGEGTRSMPGDAAGGLAAGRERGPVQRAASVAQARHAQQPDPAMTPAPAPRTVQAEASPAARQQPARPTPSQGGQTPASAGTATATPASTPAPVAAAGARSAEQIAEPQAAAMAQAGLRADRPRPTIDLSPSSLRPPVTARPDALERPAGASEPGVEEAGDIAAVSTAALEAALSDPDLAGHREQEAVGGEPHSAGIESGNDPEPEQALNGPNHNKFEAARRLAGRLEDTLGAWRVLPEDREASGLMAAHDEPEDFGLQQAADDLAASLAAAERAAGAQAVAAPVRSEQRTVAPAMAMVELSSDMATDADISTDSVEGGRPDAAKVLGTVLHVVAREAHLPVERLDPAMSFDADLGLSPIALTRVVEQAAASLGLAAVDEAIAYEDATVRQVVEHLERLVDDQDALVPNQRMTGLRPWYAPYAMHWHRVERFATPQPSGQADRSERLVLDGPFGQSEAERLLSRLRDLSRGEPVRLEVLHRGAPVSAMLRSLHREGAFPAVTLIDLGQVDGEDPRVERLCGLTAARAFAEFRLEADGAVSAPVFAPATVQTADMRRIGHVDVVLAIGCMEGLAGDCVLSLSAGSGGLVLAAPAATPARAVETMLKKAAARGIEARFVACDVNDPQAVAALAADPALAGRAPTVLIYGAPEIEAARLGELSDAAIEAALAPRCNGLVNVLVAFGAGFSRLVAFSSVIARIGLEGQSHAALASAMQSLAVERFQRIQPACTTLSIEWPILAGAAATLPVAVGADVDRMTAAEGLSLFEAMLARGAVGTVSLTGRFGQRLDLDLGQRERQPLSFSDRLILHYPGAEALLEAELNRKSDPYLDDHVLLDRALLPGVMGIEAMAEAAALVAPKREWRLTDVEFRKTVAVPADGQGIRIAAQRAGASDVVEAGLFSREDGFAAPRFKARFVPAATAEESQSLAQRYSPPPLAARPLMANLAPLYGPLFFEGSRFARLSILNDLSSRRVDVMVGAASGEGFFGAYAPQSLLLGDPSVSLGALHVVQLAVPHRRLLPTHIGAADVLGDPALIRRIVATENWVREDRYAFDIAAYDATGRPVLVLRDVRFRAVAPINTDALIAKAPQLAEVLLERLGREQLDDSLRLALVRDVTLTADQRQVAALARLKLSERALARPGEPLDGRRAGGVSVSHASRSTLAVMSDSAAGCDLSEALPDGSTPASFSEMALRERLSRVIGQGQAGEGGRPEGGRIELSRKVLAPIGLAAAIGVRQSSGTVGETARDTFFQ